MYVYIFRMEQCNGYVMAIAIAEELFNDQRSTIKWKLEMRKSVYQLSCSCKNKRL